VGGPVVGVVVGPAVVVVTFSHELGGSTQPEMEAGSAHAPQHP